MSKFNITHWINLGDFGQHEATIEGTTGDLATIDSVTVEIKGQTTQLVHLLPRDLEADLLEEIEQDQNCEADSRAEAADRKRDEQMERAA